jgi:outer membrane protein assembly factor BamD (BamD/ComL family)
MFRRTLLALPLATLLAAGAAPQPAAPPAYREGLDALSARLWEVAAARFETALATPGLEPKARQDILLRLAETRVRSGEPEAALKVLADPALAGRPELPFWKAQALAAAGQFNDALALLDDKTTAADAPYFREALFTRAALKQALGDLPGAVEALAVLIKDRDSATALRARLDTAALLLDLGEAEKALTATPPLTARMTPVQSVRADLLRARAQLEKGEHQAAEGIFAALLQKEDPAFKAVQHEAAVGLARAQLAAGNREAATDGLLAFIEQQRTSPRIGQAFPILLDCLPDRPAPDDVILTRLREWCPPAPLKSPIGIANGDGATAVWPATVAAPDELGTQALYHLALGLRREGSAESKARARQALTRLRIEYPAHPLAERALLEASRWDLADGRKEQAAAALAALDGSSSAPTLRAEASLSAAATAFAAGDFALAAGELEKASALLDGDARRDVSLNFAVTRLAMGDLPGFQALAAGESRDVALAIDLALEQALFLTAKRDPGAMAALDRFILDHPSHPRLAEARLAAAHAALEAVPPDSAFAKAQLDSLSEAQSATLPPATLTLARIRLATREKRHADAAALAETFLKALPDDPRAREIRFELGQAHFDNGDFNKARLEFEKLATASPDDPLAPPALLLAARAAVLVATPEAKAESLVLFDKLIAGKGPLADVARLEKSRVLDHPEAAKDLLPWFESMKKDHPLRLIAGLHLCDALYNSAGTDHAPLERALAIYEDLLAGLPGDSPRRFEIEYNRGRVLEQLPDPKAPSEKRVKAALDVYFSVLQAAARQAPADWQWVDKCGVRARSLLENDLRWEAAIAIAEQHAKLASPGAKEADERAKTLKLEHFIFDESE